MKLEKIIIAIACISLIAWLNRLPYYSLFLIASLFTLTITYTGLGTMHFYYFKEEFEDKKSYYTITGYLLCIVPFGIIFKLSFWPGATLINLIGTVSSSILLIILLILRAREIEDQKFRFESLLLRAILFLAVSILLSFASVSDLIKIQCRNDSELSRLKIKYFENINDTKNKQEYFDYLRKKQAEKDK